jgi:hypothetical protein
MRKLILGTMTAVMVAIGASAATFAAPVTHRFDRGPVTSHADVQRTDYYWNHHRYHHRDWDRDHHRWHYYD